MQKRTQVAPVTKTALLLTVLLLQTNQANSATSDEELINPAALRANTTTCDDPKCAVCDSTTKNCLKCKSKYDYIRINSCLSCDSGSFFDPTTKTCETCDSKNCLHCTKKDACEVCQDGFFLVNSTSPYCAKCSIPNCLNCDLKNPKICLKCGKGYFQAEDKNSCTICPYLCNECNSRTTCSKCSLNAKMDAKDNICKLVGESEKSVIFFGVGGMMLGIFSLMGLLIFCVKRSEIKANSAETKMMKFLTLKGVSD